MIIHSQANHASGPGHIHRGIDPFGEPFGEELHRPGIAIIQPVPEIILVMRRLGGSDSNPIKPQTPGVYLDMCGKLVTISHIRMSHSASITPQRITAIV